MANAQVDERFSLRVRNLPAMLSTDAITSLLFHYGAIRVRVLQRRNAASSGKEPGTDPSKKPQKAFATFTTREAQQNAQKRLHSLELAGHRLLVEIIGDEAANTSNDMNREATTTGSTKVLTGPPPLPIDLPPPLPSPRAPLLYPHFTPAPLAPHLGFNFAPSPLLAYKYPKATESIVRNIANALIALPRFYTQVLHLMNKMNLPPPFEEDAIPGRFSGKHNACYKNEIARRSPSKRCRTDNLEAQIIEEDEIDGEDRLDSAINRLTRAVEAQPPPPKSHQLNETSRTRTASNPTDHKPSCQNYDSLAAFLKKPFTRSNELLSRKRAKPDAAFCLGNESRGREVHRSTRPGVISETEVNRQRATPEELLKEPLMETYVRGFPSSSLMVKNVAHEVTEKDLRSVFGYILPKDVMLDSIKVTLLPAKNAAVIEFPDQDVATAAINELHGVHLEGKPLIVTFLNSATDVLMPTVKRWTLEELKTKRLSDTQLALEKAMKTYQRGEPSNSLYVKNLAKTVTLADLFAVFGAVLPLEFGLETLYIRHFTEGRLKCQAFVAYPTVDLAARALLQAHGVALKGKPMIVCFRKLYKTQE